MAGLICSLPVVAVYAYFGLTGLNNLLALVVCAFATLAFLLLSLKLNAPQLRSSLAAASGGRLTFTLQRVMLLLRI
jgi:hypothetical protein